MNKRKEYWWKCNQCGGSFTITTNTAPRRCKFCRCTGPLRPRTDMEIARQAAIDARRKGSITDG